MKILQISDIHWTDKHLLYDAYRDIRDSMIQDVKYYCKENNCSFDHILICGDIAFSGQQAEYDRAQQFIDELCEAASCKTSEVYMVPGNHDKDVMTNPQILRGYINELWAKEGTNEKVLNEILTKDIPSMRLVYRPFYHYDKFSERYASAEPLMHKILHAEDLNKEQYCEQSDFMYWEDELTDNLKGYRVLVYGVNTAFNSDLKDYDPGVREDGHKLFLSQVAYKAAKKIDQNINILMAHHPINFLSSSSDIQRDIDSRYKIQLFGHVHIAKSDIKNNAVHVFSGSLQPGEYGGSAEYRPVFNIIDLDIETNQNGNDVLIVGLQVHYWSGDTFVIDKLETSDFKVTLENHNRHKIDKPMVETLSLPEGITKRDIRIKLTQVPNLEKVINEVSQGRFTYDNRITDYVNAIHFMEFVRQNNLWIPLWNIIK